MATATAPTPEPAAPAANRKIEVADLAKFAEDNAVRPSGTETVIVKHLFANRFRLNFYKKIDLEGHVIRFDKFLGSQFVVVNDDGGKLSLEDRTIGTSSKPKLFL